MYLINEGVTVEDDMVSVQFSSEGDFDSYQCSVDGNVLGGICELLKRLCMRVAIE